MSAYRKIHGATSVKILHIQFLFYFFPCKKQLWMLLWQRRGPIWQNHRIIEIGKDLWGSCNSIPLLQKLHQIKSFAGLSPVSLCLSCPLEPRTEHSTPVVASPVLHRGERQPLFCQCPVLCLMQPRQRLVFFATRAHCLLMFSLEATRTCRCFFAKLLSSHVVPGMCSIILPQGQDLAFPSGEFHEIPVGIPTNSRLLPVSQIRKKYFYSSTSSHSCGL